MAHELIKIDFHGDELQVFEQDNKVWVVLKRCCESIGIAYEGQRQRLCDKERSPWACTCLMQVHDASGRQQEAYLIDLDSLPMWLATISPKRVKVEIRTKLALYQAECAKVLRDHFFGKSSSQEASLATLLVKLTETLTVKMTEMISTAMAVLITRLDRLESERVAPLGPFFSPRERLNQLLGINAVYRIRESWKQNVMRQVLGEAARLGIALLRSGSGGSVVLMPIQFQAWAEQLMMMRISDWMTSQKTPLFDGQGTAH